MRKTYRLLDYEKQLYRFRFVFLGLCFYSVAAIVMDNFVRDNLYILLGALVVFAGGSYLLGCLFSNLLSEKRNNRKERVFWALGFVNIAAYLISAAMECLGLQYVELIALFLFVALAVYALYLAHLIGYMKDNRDVEKEAMHHVIIGNMRAFRLWYLVVTLVVLSFAVLPVWTLFDSIWKWFINVIRSLLGNHLNFDSTVKNPELNIGDALNPDAESILNVSAKTGKTGSFWTEILPFLILAVIFMVLAYCLGKFLISKINDQRTTMMTDRVIDLKFSASEYRDEIIRTRNEDVDEDNVYAKRIRKTFKRTVFDRFGEQDIPEKTPEELLNRADGSHEVLLEKYEKARYSDIPCTSDDVKAVKESVRKEKIENNENGISS